MGREMTRRQAIQRLAALAPAAMATGAPIARTQACLREDDR